jgi:thiamine biosynthesis lipoprotein
VEIETANGHETRALENTVVATSGDTEQHVVIDGVRYSHVVEPASGRATSRGTGATVIGPDGARADALATAATLLDPVGRRRLEAEYPGYVFIVRPDA